MTKEFTKLYVLSMNGKNMSYCNHQFEEEFTENFFWRDTKVDNYSFGKSNESKESRLIYPVNATIIRTEGFPPEGEHNFVLSGKSLDCLDIVFNRIKKKGFDLEEVAMEETN